MEIEYLKNNIFKIQDQKQFESLAIEVFKYQYYNNNIYKRFVDYLNVDINTIDRVENIPFLPIELFKSNKVLVDNKEAQIEFSSSGTTSVNTSTHFVADIEIYKQSFRKAFEIFYGDIKDYTILGLLPSYLERSGSSLIYMVDDLIKESKSPDSGFYLHNHGELYEKLISLDSKSKKVLLIGVSFALLDFVEKYKMKLKNTFIMETGGMKGMRKELLREELHSILKEGFGLDQIHSEYGMTELLSQAYSQSGETFSTPPWMKVLLRDTEDPLTIVDRGSGAINVIDLANLESCSFIATQDLGRINKEGFEVIGRFDHSDVRGCNLMIL
jgi:phenylacetate-coenzyme A ligase PaaK-like adenylate-forming protein